MKVSIHFLRQSFTINYSLSGSWYIIQIHILTLGDKVDNATWFLFLSAPPLLADVVVLRLERSLTLLHSFFYAAVKVAHYCGSVVLFAYAHFKGNPPC